VLLRMAAKLAALITLSHHKPTMLSPTSGLPSFSWELNCRHSWTLKRWWTRGVETSVADGEVRGWWALVCLLFSTRIFRFLLSPDSMEDTRASNQFKLVASRIKHCRPFQSGSPRASPWVRTSRNLSSDRGTIYSDLHGLPHSLHIEIPKIARTKYIAWSRHRSLCQTA
jgi:asparagine N-glycosylation enzyme membrane subunit Stt3